MILTKAVALVASSSALKMRLNGKDIDIKGKCGKRNNLLEENRLQLNFSLVSNGRGNLRTYKDMEGLAVELFNNDPVVIEKLGENAFNRASWTKEVGVFSSVQDF